MAYRQVPSTNMARAQQDLRDAPRSKVESGLTFAGFLLFDCDLKADSKSVIRELRNSNHRVIMITGDSAYTAADVASKLGMTRTGADSGLLNLELLSAQPSKNSTNAPSKGMAADEGLVWRKVLGTGVGMKSTKAAAAAAAAVAVSESKVEIPFNPSKDALRALAAQYSLCVTGPSLVALLGDSALNDRSNVIKALCPNVTVFARVSPAQKVQSNRNVDDLSVDTFSSHKSYLSLSSSVICIHHPSSFVHFFSQLKRPLISSPSFFPHCPLIS